jgi:hypothetical protein
MSATDASAFAVTYACNRIRYRAVTSRFSNDL